MCYCSDCCPQTGLLLLLPLLRFLLWMHSGRIKIPFPGATSTCKNCKTAQRDARDKREGGDKGPGSGGFLYKWDSCLAATTSSRSMNPLQIHHLVKKSQKSLNTMQIPEALIQWRSSWGHSQHGCRSSRGGKRKRWSCPWTDLTTAVNLVMMDECSRFLEEFNSNLF